MSSRDEILRAVKANQPATTILPDIRSLEVSAPGSMDKFAGALKTIGGKVYYVNSYTEVINIMLSLHGECKMISPITELKQYYSEEILNSAEIRDIHDINVLIMRGQFAVAENGAIWVVEEDMHQRALPFICQHLAIIINSDSVVQTMHDAYERIAKTTYGFGTFIAGPSKTADIEQSLVIGAHGPRSMAAFILLK